MRHLTWQEVKAQAEQLAKRIRHRSSGMQNVYGVPQGGAPVALIVAELTESYHC